MDDSSAGNRPTMGTEALASYAKNDLCNQRKACRLIRVQLEAIEAPSGLPISIQV